MLCQLVTLDSLGQSMPVFTAEEAPSIINLGCALVHSGLTIDYANLEMDAVAGSLLELLGADKFAEPQRAAELDERYLLSLLDSWVIPVEDGSRYPTAIECAKAIKTWRVCRTAAGKEDQQAPAAVPDLTAQLQQQQQFLVNQQQALAGLLQAQNVQFGMT